MDAQNDYGNTPLHSAAATGTVDVVSVSASDVDRVQPDGNSYDRRASLRQRPETRPLCFRVIDVPLPLYVSLLACWKHYF